MQVAIIQHPFVSKGGSYNMCAYQAYHERPWLADCKGTPLGFAPTRLLFTAKKPSAPVLICRKCRNLLENLHLDVFKDLQVHPLPDVALFAHSATNNYCFTNIANLLGP